MNSRRSFLAHAGALAALAAAAAAAVPALADDTAEAPVTIADAPPLTQARAAATSLPFHLGLPLLSRDGPSPLIQDQFDTPAVVERRGAAVAITVRLWTSFDGPVLVDLEVYDPVGRRVDQQFADNVRVRGGQRISLPFTYTPGAGAPAGEYAVRVGVFRGDWHWETLYHWNHNAATFTLP